ncbi:uncharacterized protein F5891DRAFT_979962 [Suillus fuscotomentosus]|uniref:Uncharacterized protein n=1 Tax=Suillus fuscotomentosus TaxID=1912939 RepID=A0AAD4E6Z6_9AGAM|nr:uncharacterized protein F5891DRAFT_979962 [Suillus fuscotomentosus]KAG1900727.1 hypothetical protein F5891DRAFT_979962 [Suillus fuscotomentosus]
MPRLALTPEFQLTAPLALAAAAETRVPANTGLAAKLVVPCLRRRCPESIVPDDIAAEFAALGELKRTEDSDIQSSEPIGEVEALEGNALDLDRGEYHNERIRKMSN